MVEWSEVKASTRWMHTEGGVTESAPIIVKSVLLFVNMGYIKINMGYIKLLINGEKVVTPERTIIVSFFNV